MKPSRRANRYAPVARSPAPAACRPMLAHVPPRPCHPPCPNRTDACGGVAPHASTGHRTPLPPRWLRGRHVLAWSLRGRFGRPRHPLRVLRRAAIQKPEPISGRSGCSSARSLRGSDAGARAARLLVCRRIDSTSCRRQTPVKAMHGGRPLQEASLTASAVRAAARRRRPARSGPHRSPRSSRPWHRR